MAKPFDDTLHAQNLGHVLFTKWHYCLETPFYIALSGGMDSVVLLHLFYTLRKQHPNLQVTALHFNHGVHANSTAWSQFCSQLCEQFSIAFVCGTATDNLHAQANLESAAREARYAWLEQTILQAQLPDSRHACLVTAHHLDDLAESVFLDLSKGRGLSAFYAMPETRSLSTHSTISLCRPMLHITRAQIEAYALSNRLEYVSDPSNDDVRFDRNFLRKFIIPSLQERWPKWAHNVAKVAKQQNEKQNWQGQYFSSLIAQYQRSEKATLVCRAAPLNGAILQQYNNQFCYDFLNHWLYVNQVALPSGRALDEFLQQITRQKQGYAQLIVNASQLAFYDNTLYLLNQDTIQSLSQLARTPTIVSVNPLETTRVAQLQLQFVSQASGIDKKFLQGAHWQLRFRTGGECMRLPGQPSKSLKQHFQEKRIAKWMREILPILYIDGQIAWVPNVGISEQFLTNENGLNPNLCMLK